MKNDIVRLDFRLSREDRNLIKTRAAARGMKLHDYIMHLVNSDIYVDIEKGGNFNES